MKISVRCTLVRGKPSWVVSRRGSDGKVKRRHFRTEKEALAEKSDLERQAAKAGDVWVSLPGTKRSELIDVAQEIAEAGLTLRDVWLRHKMSEGVTGSIPIEQAVKECIASKSAIGRRPQYIETLSYALGRFARGREAQSVASITTADCEAWLAECKARSSRASFQSRLSTLFAWCVQQGYCQRNPCDRLGRVSLEQRPPVILSPEKVDDAIAWLSENEDFRGYLVLGLFCGIRPDELQRLGWESVDLARGIVTIDAATSKVRRRRIVPIAARAVRLLRGDCDEDSQAVAVLGNRAHMVWPGSPATLRRRKRALARHLGFTDWPSDLLRHTAASYLMARDGDAGRVANWLGNSPSVLLTRYRELVAPEDSERFWAEKKNVGGGDKS